MAGKSKNSKMKLSVKEIINVNTGFNTLGNKELPIALSWKIARFQRVLTPIIEDYDEKNKEMVKKYGTLQDNGTYNIKKEKIEQYNKDKDALLAQEEELDVPTFSFSDDFEQLENLAPSFFNFAGAVMVD